MATDSAVAILLTANSEYRVKKTLFVGGLESGWRRNAQMIDETFSGCRVLKSLDVARTYALRERSTLGAILIDCSDVSYANLIQIADENHQLPLFVEEADSNNMISYFAGEWPVI